MTKKYKRRNFFIKKKFQGRYMFMSYMVLAGTAFILSLMLIFLSSDSMTLVYRNNDLLINRTPLALFWQFAMANWVLLIPCGLLVVLYALFQTHRTAGPLYRFEKALDEMNKGHIGRPVMLREKDEAKEVADKLTSFNKTLAAKIKSLAQTHEEINRIISSEGDCSDKLERIKRLNADAINTLDFFTVADE